MKSFPIKSQTSRRLHGLVLAIGASGLLAACSALPGQGPMSFSLINDDRSTQKDSARNAGRANAVMPDFTLLEIDRQVVETLGRSASRTISRRLADASSPVPVATLGIGDRLEIEIWEAGPDGLFSTGERRSARFTLRIEEDGEIQLPYTGRIDAAGLTPETLRQRLEESLQGKAIEPQVQVRVEERAGRKISVIGDVAGPGRVTTPPGGIRILDAIAAAGGQTEPASETSVSILRGRMRETVRLSDILANSANNILLQPHDIVQVSHEPKTFTAFGAVGNPGETDFGSADITLAQALARAKGLDNMVADPGGIFLFRMEDPGRMRRAGRSPKGAVFREGTPVVYRLDMSSPQAFFNAQSFRVADGDILYVANAPAAEFRKFVMTIISPLVGNFRATQSLTE